MSPTLGGSSGGSSDSFSDRQFIAITSEKTARVIALPSQNCVYRQQIADTDYVVKAEIISFKGKVCSLASAKSTDFQSIPFFLFCCFIHFYLCTIDRSENCSFHK